MAGKDRAIFGIYPNRPSAEAGVDALKSVGFRNTDISVLFPEKEGTKDFAHEKNTKAPEGASKGAGTGAVLGGGLGWLVGIGALAIPGLGPFVAAGPIMAALAGAGVGGALGGITGALIGMGIPEYEAKRYEGRVKEGGILLSVHSDSSEWTVRAKEILERTGARDISSTGAVGEASANEEKEDPLPQERAVHTGDFEHRVIESAVKSDHSEEIPASVGNEAGKQTMQLLEEELDVQKERVPKGEVRLRKEVVAETQNIEVPVAREELDVERRPGTEAGDAGQMGDRREVRVPLTEERVKVRKRPVVREEVEVGKRSVTEMQQISEQVRREQLQIEEDPNVQRQETGREEQPTKKLA